MQSPTDGFCRQAGFCLLTKLRDGKVEPRGGPLNEVRESSVYRAEPWKWFSARTTIGLHLKGRFNMVKTNVWEVLADSPQNVGW